MKTFNSFLFILLLTTFTQGSLLSELEWQVVNDSVMGGISQSQVNEREEGIRFAGILSLENNGGFASIRSAKSMEVDPSVTVVVITVRGDGRTYSFDLRNSNRRRAFSYRNSFKTVAGETTTLRLPLRDFIATSFGRRIPNAAQITASEIRSVGMTLSDKNPGPFRLDILKIEFETTEIEMEAFSSGLDLIDKAISFGVPMYNHGNTQACAMIYEVALRSFLTEDHPEVSENHQRSIRKAMATLPADMDARAWALRRELDTLRMELDETPL